MAYSFNGTNQFLSASSPITLGSVTTTPSTFSMSAWIYPTGGQNTRRGILSVYRTNNNGRCSIVLGANNLAIAYVNGAVSATRIHSSVSSVSLNNWHHVIGIFSASLSPTIYLNGVIGTLTTNNTLGLQTGDSNFGIGLERASTSWFNGLIADVAIWNTNTINSNEIISLSKGISASKIRPQSLIFYAPLIRDLSDCKANRTITNNNSATVADHPRIYY